MSDAFDCKEMVPSLKVLLHFDELPNKLKGTLNGTDGRTYQSGFNSLGEFFIQTVDIISLGC